MNERINTNHAKEPNEDAHGLTKERRGILLLFIFQMDSFRRIFQAWTSSCPWSCLVIVFVYLSRDGSWLAETRCRKRERAVSRFLINSRVIHLIWRFYYNVSVNSHSQLSAYSKGNAHSTSRCKHVEQCHIRGDKTRAAYMSFGYV